MINFVRKSYDALSRVPGGRSIFSKIICRMVPYSGTIAPKVEEIREGYARVSMREKREVRNHLKSVHAIALTNLAEVTSGLAFLYGLPDHTRGIVTHLSIEFVKKARGRLVAECHCPKLKSNAAAEHEVEAEIKDSSNQVVARAKARWKVGPDKR